MKWEIIMNNITGSIQWLIPVVVSAIGITELPIGLPSNRITVSNISIMGG